MSQRGTPTRWLRSTDDRHREPGASRAKTGFTPIALATHFERGPGTSHRTDLYTTSTTESSRFVRQLGFKASQITSSGQTPSLAYSSTARWVTQCRLRLGRQLESPWRKCVDGPSIRAHTS